VLHFFCGGGLSVVIWFGYAIWWEHPGAELGCFFRLPGRGGHLGGPATKWGGRGRPAGHAAVPPAVPRWPLPLAGLRGPFFSRGVVLVGSG
jgi:hypothetical protein